MSVAEIFDRVRITAVAVAFPRELKLPDTAPNFEIANLTLAVATKDLERVVATSVNYLGLPRSVASGWTR